MIERGVIMSSQFMYEGSADHTMIDLRVATDGCRIPRHLAVYAWEEDQIADVSVNFAAYKMKCELCGVEKRMDEREFNLYKYLTDGNKK